MPCKAFFVDRDDRATLEAVEPFGFSPFSPQSSKCPKRHLSDQFAPGNFVMCHVSGMVTIYLFRSLERGDEQPKPFSGPCFALCRGNSP